MKTIDNSPIDKPCIGQIIEEKCSVGQFYDNCIYLFAEKDSAIAKKALELMKQFKAQGEAYINTYELEVVMDVELEGHPKIKERVEKHGDNLLLQISTPSEECTKKFIVAKTDENRLVSDLALMMYEAERITAYSLKAILKEFAMDNTEEFVRLARNAAGDTKFLTKYFEGLIGNILSPSFGMAMSVPDMGSQVIKGVITHRQRMEMYDRFLDNLKECHKHPDPKTIAELDYIISNIDPSTLRRLFLRQSPKLMEKINDHINPKRMAEVSTMDLEVRKIGSIDKNRKNDGRYRLFMNRGYETVMVHFSRKSGFILYLIYLLDRKKSEDKVDTLKISQYKELFGKLYFIVYGINGETIFSDIMKNFNANKEAQQKGLYSVLKSIRDDVGAACERMQEPPEPFLLRDIAAHLAVLPEHIILPPEIMTMI